MNRPKSPLKFRRRDAEKLVDPQPGLTSGAPQGHHSAMPRTQRHPSGEPAERSHKSPALPKMRLNVTERQKEFLEESAAKLGISPSEFLRRVLEAFLQDDQAKKMLLTRALAPIGRLAQGPADRRIGSTRRNLKPALASR